jgi:hypothetical protein
MTTVDSLTDSLRALQDKSGLPNRTCGTGDVESRVSVYALESPQLRYGVVVGGGFSAPGRNFLSR